MVKQYSLEEKLIIAMSLYPTYPSTKVKRIWKFLQREKIYLAFEDNMGKIVQAFGREVYENLLEITTERVERYIKNLSAQNVVCLTILDSEYPSCLRQTGEDAPILLFCKGDLSLLSTPKLAIVGSRDISYYGVETTSHFAKELSREGMTIVSGLAEGVDTISHRITLENGGKTIGVLGGGFNRIYPASNTNLAQEMCEKGLLITEYAPATSPTKFTFPVRNRIIAAISDATLITEARENSGAMHTKRYAQKYGKTVYVVPASIFTEKGQGSNLLISSREVKVVLNATDILKDMSITHEPPIKALKKPEHIQLTIEEESVISALSMGEKNTEELVAITKMEYRKLAPLLSLLEIKGQIQRKPGNMFSLKYE